LIFGLTALEKSNIVIVMLKQLTNDMQGEHYA